MKPRGKDKTVERLLDGLAPPSPPPELRSRVLAAARSGARAEPVADVWTRIRENPWLRLIWAVSVVALILGHLALTARRSPAPTDTAAYRADEGIVEFLRPMRIEESASPNLGRELDEGRAIVPWDEGGNEP